MTGRLAAVLWDMDGLLADTEPLWTVAEVELAARLGGEWDDALKARIAGTRLDVAVPTILEHYGVAVTEESAGEAAEFLLQRVEALFASDLQLMPGALSLLAALSGAGVPQALVSSSYRVLVDAVLAQVPACFATTLAGDEVRRGKPDPEPYLTAADRLGVEPARCVVLEDSRAGAASGVAAGCAVVAVPSVRGTRIAAAPRLAVRSSLEGLTLDALEALL